MIDAKGAQIPPVADSVTQGAVREGILELPGILPLHHGGQLEGVRIAWRLVGERGPVVAALGGISAGRYVTDVSPAFGHGRGWWADVVGPGKSLDSTRYRVLGFDFLGGSGQTTGPRSGQTGFPSISSLDQAEVLARLLDHLQIQQLHAIVGASYGAMVALAFAQRFGARVARVVAISGADRTHPLSTAWRSVQRSVVRYALTKGDGAEGLRLARALAMATYRSSQEFAARFSGPAIQIDGQFQFPVESYLLSRGEAYAASYIPEAFVCLSESIDLHAVDATQIRVPVTLVAVREDQIVPLSDMQALRSKLGDRAVLVEFSSLYGHDAFLKEVAALQCIFRDALDVEAT
jgi:homoserine O-acetyltransferase/O-succinyltransferase